MRKFLERIGLAKKEPAVDKMRLLSLIALALEKHERFGNLALYEAMDTPAGKFIRCSHRKGVVLPEKPIREFAIKMAQDEHKFVLSRGDIVFTTL